METRVQRKLEFQVKKSTRSTRLRQKSLKENQSIKSERTFNSPKKRYSDDENDPVETSFCSPSKQKKENGSRRCETPSSGRLQGGTPSRRGLREETPNRRTGHIKNSREENIYDQADIKKSSGKENTPKKNIAKKLIDLDSDENKPKVSVKPIFPLSPNVKSRQVIPLGSPAKVTPLSPVLSPVKINTNNSRHVQVKGSPILELQKPECSAYNLAKQSFHTAKPERLVGREEEIKEITSFVTERVTKKSSGSLYISGAPGTGKTAVLTHILDDVKKSHSCKCQYLNCMTLKDSATVYGKLYTNMTGKSPPPAKDRLRAVEKCLSASGPSIILVLDEIDQLDSKNQEILYTIFEWPSIPKSRLILIGIANALDLTDRVLPRLQARPNCKPKLLNFAPYSKDQIAAILNDRLRQAQEEGVTIMEPSAVQFCARKISAVAGDMRKALDVCRRAVEVVERDVKSQQVLKVVTCNSPKKAVSKKIGVIQIFSVLSDVYGSSSSGNDQDSIPLQQKLVVCTLLLMVKLGRMKEVTMGKLHDTYSKVCKKRHMAAVDYSEYQAISCLLETRGIMSIKKAKDGRMAKVTLKLDEKELEHTLQDKVLMSSILQDGLPPK